MESDTFFKIRTRLPMDSYVTGFLFPKQLGSQGEMTGETRASKTPKMREAGKNRWAERVFGDSILPHSPGTPLLTTSGVCNCRRLHTHLCKLALQKAYNGNSCEDINSNNTEPTRSETHAPGWAPGIKTSLGFGPCYPGRQRRQHHEEATEL